jgi:hypothetical protein
MMFVQRSTIGSTLSALSGGKHRHQAGHAHFIEALHPVEILAEREGGDLERAST